MKKKNYLTIIFYFSFLLVTQLLLLICLVLAMAKAFAGTSSVIVEPAAIKASSSIATGDTKLALQPIKASFPIVVLCLFYHHN